LDDSYATRTLTRTINVSSAPRMTLSATQLRFSGLSTDTVISQLTQPLSVAVTFSEGGSTTPWTVTAPTGLSFHTPSTGTGNGMITVSLDALNGFVNSGLFPASGLEYDLTVSSPGAAAGTQTQTIRVVIALAEGQASAFTATPATVTIPAGGGSRDLAIRSTVQTAPWRVSSSASWLSFHRVEGRGDGFVAVTAEANAGASRTATILAAGRMITVTQEGTGGGGGGGSVVPGAPSAFTASASGLQLSGSWTVPTTGGAPTSYVVEASGTADFASVLATIPVPTGTSFSMTAPDGAAGGTFYLRVRGVNAAGTGAPSTGQSVTFAGGGGGGAAPGAPTSVALSAATVAPGGSVTLSWLAPTTGGTPATYIVEASGVADFSGGALQLGGVTDTSYTIAVPADIAPGRYFLRVAAQNQSGRGQDSDVVTLTVGPLTLRVVPAAAPATGGTSVTITGTGLQLATGVFFGTTPATSFTVVNDSTVTAVVPQGAAGATTVTVTVPGRTVPPANFTFLAPNAMNTTAVSSGPVTSRTLTAAIVPKPSDIGKAGAVFVAAIVNNMAFFLNGANNSWVSFTSCNAVPTVFTGSLAVIGDIPILSSIDLSGLIGLQVFVGYGVGTPAATACQSMLINATYELVHTVS